jgi:2-oxoglutarate ferredoxin oxidoreductase subunit delta
MNKIFGAITVNKERCKGCNLCTLACPKQIISLTSKEVNHKGYRFAQQTDYEPCVGCAACAVVCPDGCITVYRKKATT